MKILNKKTISTILILMISLQFIGIKPVRALDLPIQQAPSKLRIEPIYNVEPNIQPPIGYNEYDGYYADFKWESPTPTLIADKTYTNLYIKEIAKPYNLPKPDALKESNMGVSQTTVRLKGLNSGTIYSAFSRAYYTYNRGISNNISPESALSNQVRFMTDIEIDAHSYGVNQIKIEWDDVWDSNKRISYRLYVSEHKDFSGTQPMYINQDLIGVSGPIKINQYTGKLEYIYTVRDPGRVYYVKIAPDVEDPLLKKTPESKVAVASSFILAKTSKMHSTDFGTTWRLDWSPVITGLNSKDIKISYFIYRGEVNSNNVPQYLATVDDTNFFVTLSEQEGDVYFIVRAIITKDGENYYPGINIESDKIIIKESEVFYQPAAPELVEEFLDASGDIIINYSNQLTSRDATILWRAPKKADGTIDQDITYNMWLVDNPNIIDSPPEASIIASKISIDSKNYVLKGNQVIGYKYIISNLKPHSTYYVKIEAQKSYIDYKDGKLERIILTSESSTRSIITPAEGPIDQPVIPARPPLTIKKANTTTGESYMITATTAVIQMKNRWYEKYVSGRWEHISEQEYYNSDPNHNNDYRILEYDPGVTFNVGFIEYQEDMSYQDLEDIPANKIIGHSVIGNDLDENPLLNADGKKHNVDIVISQLQPNTTYLVWVRAARLEAGLISGPSDPIVLTTNYDYVEVSEKPTTPVFSYSQAGDTYIDLTWDFRLNTNYKYHIKYSVIENFDSTVGSKTVGSKELADSALSYYRISDLDPGTTYYFWIQAESIDSTGHSIRSQWSDSYGAKTLPIAPPNTPKGFGIKNSKDSITKNSITYEWIIEEGVEYILQLGRDATFRDAVRYPLGNIASFEVEGLISNHRYYARLYAYDNVNKLESMPSKSVTCRTSKSYDDYDSNQDVEKTVSGDFIKKAATSSEGVWDIKIIGEDADRLIEHMKKDRVLDYEIDLTNPPVNASKIRLLISAKIFSALDILKENILIKVADRKYVFRPGVIKTNRAQAGYDYEIIIGLNNLPSINVGKLVLKTEINELKINMYNAKNSIMVTDLDGELRVMYQYKDPNWFKEGNTSGYVVRNSKSAPIKVNSSAVFDYSRGEGYITFDIDQVGNTLVAEQ